MREFEGKVAVVTGAASGIGRAMADRFAEAGMKVVLGDVEEQALNAAVTEMRQAEHDVLGVRCDVSTEAAIQDLADRTLEAYGGVHILCNNAGVVAGGSIVGDRDQYLWEQPLSDWQWTIDVNLWGVIHGVRIFTPIMLAQDEPGHIVNTAPPPVSPPAARSASTASRSTASCAFPRRSTSTSATPARRSVRRSSARAASAPASPPPSQPPRRPTRGRHPSPRCGRDR